MLPLLRQTNFFLAIRLVLVYRLSTLSETGILLVLLWVVYCWMIILGRINIFSCGSYFYMRYFRKFCDFKFYICLGFIYFSCWYNSILYWAFRKRYSQLKLKICGHFHIYEYLHFHHFYMFFIQITSTNALCKLIKPKVYLVYLLFFKQKNVHWAKNCLCRYLPYKF